MADPLPWVGHIKTPNHSQIYLRLYPPIEGVLKNCFWENDPGMAISQGYKQPLDLVNSRLTEPVSAARFLFVNHGTMPFEARFRS